VGQENVELVRRIYEAFARQDRAALAEFLHPDIELTYLGVLIDKQVTYRGLSGVREFMRSIVENFEEFSVDVEELVDAGDQVVAALHQRARGRASGAQVDIRIGQVWTVRDGQAVAWRIYPSNEDALASLESAS
jgi:ketosteroid isomerase-like protein